jgi:hypothetical protein
MLSGAVDGDDGAVGGLHDVFSWIGVLIDRTRWDYLMICLDR